MKRDKNIKVGIFGYGEIGKALSKFYGPEGSANVKIKDLNRDDGLRGVDILHVCIPYNDKFVGIVEKEIKNVKPKITIIHSTIAPGTIEKIGGMVVHSPVRGVHPFLFEGMKTFVKYIGADNKEAGEMAKNHLEGLGIKTKLVYPAKTSELAKLFCTTYYGVCIAWHKDMKKICDKLGVDFEQVVTDFNKTYNEGYTKLGKTNVVRPVLFVDDKPIGGHCVVPNAKILKNYFESRAFDFILDYEKKDNK
jgi:hypothetical protein